MIEATLLNYVGDRHGQEVIHNVMYEFPGVAASSQSSELIAIEIPALSVDSSLNNSRDYHGNSELFVLTTMSIQCSSTDFDFKVFNKNDMTAADTIFEILAYEEINLHTVDSFFDEYVIRNRDDIKDNRLYVWLKNDDVSNAMGDVTLELSYRTVQYNT